MAEKLTKREEALAKRAGKGGRAFVLARRKRPGLTLLEHQSTKGNVEELDVDTTAAPPVEAAPTPEPAPAKKTAAKKTAGSSGR